MSALCGYEVKGMAYPCGGVNNDDRVAAVVREKTGVRYARTITSSYSFDLPRNLYRLHPTVYYVEIDRMFDLADAFLASRETKPMLFYIWGHTFETVNGAGQSWETLEKFCKKISAKEDVFYGTNSEVLQKLF